MTTTDTITAATPFPFTVVRDLIAYDDFNNADLTFKAVRITIERADWSLETVEAGGFDGDHFIHLRDDDRYRHLPAATLDCAEDAACQFIEDLAWRLAHGEAVPACDSTKAWHYKANCNA